MTKQSIQSFRSVGGHCIPEHMINVVLGYFTDHRRPGAFLQALLKNDLMEACARADDTNAAALTVWASFLYSEAPSGSFGSPEKVEAWLDCYRHDAKDIPANYVLRGDGFCYPHPAEKKRELAHELLDRIADF